MKRIVLLGLWLTLTLNQMALAQPFVRLYGEDGTNATSASNPLPTSASVTVDSIESITDPVGVLGANGSAITSGTNPFPIRISADGTNFMDATHGGYVNILQGNNVLDDNNPLPTGVICNGAIVSTGNPLSVGGLVSVIGTDGLTISAPSNPLPSQMYWVETAGSILHAVSDTNPLPIVGGITSLGTVTNPVPLMGGDGALIAATTNPIPAQLSQGNAAAAETNPIPTQLSNGADYIDTTHPLATQLSQGDTAISATNPVPVGVNGTSGTAIAAPTNPLDVRPSADGTNPVDTTHPLDVRPSADGTNPVTADHPLPTQLSQGDAALTAQNPIFAAPSGVLQASITNTNTAIPAASTQVTLAAASAHIRIHNNSSTETLYVDLTDDTATSADYAILPGDSMEPYDGAPITTFKVIGTNAADTYNVLAW